MTDSQEEQRNSLSEENRGLRDRAAAEMNLFGNKNPLGISNSLVEENRGLRDRARAEMAEGNKNPFGLSEKLLEEFKGLQQQVRDQGIKASFSDTPPSTQSTPNNAKGSQEIGGL